MPPMKKLWQRSIRKTRSWARKQKLSDQAIASASQAEEKQQQQEQGQQATATSAMTQPQDNSLFIFLNDFTDSDNGAAAIVWAKWLQKHPGVTGLYIAEPRPVNLGYYMSGKDFGECMGLVKRLRSTKMPTDTAVSMVLGGYMTKEIIDDAKWQDIDGDDNPVGPQRALDATERALLERCIRAEDGPKEDTLRHAKLMTLDYLNLIRAGSGNTDFETYIDAVCVKDYESQTASYSHLESPINIKTHYHEELVFRTPAELDAFQEITMNTNGDRHEKLKHWYKQAVDRKLAKDFDGKDPTQLMDNYSLLFNKMKQYDRIIFFGGSSLTILHHVLLLEPDLASKIDYYQQGGTSDPKLNILGNPLNFALNYKAARYILTEDKNYNKLRSFTLIPTDTTKKILFTLHGLNKWSPEVGVHSLAFCGRADPWTWITEKERDVQEPSTEQLVKWRSELVSKDTYAWWPPCSGDATYKPPNKASAVIMADFLAFLLSFTDAFDDISLPEGKVEKFIKRVSIELEQPPKGSMRTNEAIILKPNDAQDGVQALMLEVPKPVLPKMKKRDPDAVPVVRDTSELVEKAIETSSFPDSSSTLPTHAAREDYSTYFWV